MTIPLHTKALACSHVFDASRPVLFVEHAQGAWLLLCKPYYTSASPLKAVTLEHLLDRDPTINQVMDLPDGYYAERTAITEPWVRQQLT